MFSIKAASAISNIWAAFAKARTSSIPFTSGQLNDVLKSLTVLDLNGGRITGVEYGSAAPMDRQLGDLRLPVGEKASLTEFLGALRGARLEVRSGTSIVTGRLLSVERKTRIAGGTTLEVDYLSLIADNGELRTTELTPAFSVKLLDRGLPAKMDRFLDVVSAGREADLRRMVISTSGTGDRSLFVSYISEVPVWKTTYRIVLSSKAKPLLQGWAIVDNTVGEDWDKVELSLVAGAPHSFIQNLSQPYYSGAPWFSARRNSGSPQTYEATLIPSLAAAIGNGHRSFGGPNSRMLRSKRIRSVARYWGRHRRMPMANMDLNRFPKVPLRLEIQLSGFRTTSISGLNFSSSKPVQQNVDAAGREQCRIGDGKCRSASTPNRESTLSGQGRGLGSGAALGGRSYAKSAPPPPAAQAAFSVPSARAQALSAVQAQELGDLFEYKLKEPITIRKNRSALVPIVQSPIIAEKVSVWNEQSGLPRPQRAFGLQFERTDAGWRQLQRDGG